MRGRLFCVIGPSGVGKDTLIGAAVAARPGLHWARRSITRPERAGGEPHEGLSPAEFDQRLAAGTFAVHWRAHGLAYGVAHGELAPLDSSRDVIFNGARGALEAIRAALPRVQILHLTARPETLARRLAGRGRESGAQIAQRLERAAVPLPRWPDMVEIANDGALDQALAAMLAALDSGIRPSR
ncbi:MAG TPA: phosphonate metabolism protein/1,5-bisphosphokinase (PRPP-forming) PhnN [Paracoccus sp.]|nr:phosphonate metabolism protein/1,5-bisphosphokinase (PRPP-forming) PhnN [Paracoccus sp. (in: a-proteobacteria)]